MPPRVPSPSAHSISMQTPGEQKIDPYPPVYNAPAPGQPRGASWLRTLIDAIRPAGCRQPATHCEFLVLTSPRSVVVQAMADGAQRTRRARARSLRWSYDGGGELRNAVAVIRSGGHASARRSRLQLSWDARKSACCGIKHDRAWGEAAPDETAASLAARRERPSAMQPSEARISRFVITRPERRRFSILTHSICHGGARCKTVRCFQRGPTAAIPLLCRIVRGCTQIHSFGRRSFAGRTGLLTRSSPRSTPFWLGGSACSGVIV
jgi:hypothetical protein